MHNRCSFLLKINSRKLSRKRITKTVKRRYRKVDVDVTYTFFCSQEVSVSFFFFCRKKNRN